MLVAMLVVPRYRWLAPSLVGIVLLVLSLAGLAWNRPILPSAVAVCLII
jgi:uncharacterized membrane protein YqjE